MILDREKALERLDGNRDLYNKMISYFIRDYSDYPERIMTLLSTRDNEAYILTHSLKNMASSLGADTLSRRALNLEFYLKKGDFENARPMVEMVLQDFTPLLTEMQTLYSREGILPLAEKKIPPNADYAGLLTLLSESLRSFSPIEVEKSVKMVRQSWDIIPREDREELSQILEMADDFRYFEGEEKLLELLEK